MMYSRSRIAMLAVILALALGMLPGAVPPAQAAGTVSLTAFGTAYTQDFNTWPAAEPRTRPCRRLGIQREWHERKYDV